MLEFALNAAEAEINNKEVDEYLLLLFPYLFQDKFFYSILIPKSVIYIFFHLVDQLLTVDARIQFS